MTSIHFRDCAILANQYSLRENVYNAVKNNYGYLDTAVLKLVTGYLKKENKEVAISYCRACGYDDQSSEEMVDIVCQRCGATKYEDGSVSYDGSREVIEDAKDHIEEFDRRYDN